MRLSILSMVSNDGQGLLWVIQTGRGHSRYTTLYIIEHPWTMSLKTSNCVSILSLRHEEMLSDTPLQARYQIKYFFHNFCSQFRIPNLKCTQYTPSPHVCERKANYSLTSQNPVYTEHTFCVARKLSPACLDTEPRPAQPQKPYLRLITKMWP